MVTKMNDEQRIAYLTILVEEHEKELALLRAELLKLQKKSKSNLGDQSKIVSGIDSFTDSAVDLFI